MVSPSERFPLIRAIVLAGSRPGQDPLTQAFGVSTKALVPLAGEPMLSRVVRTLLSHPRIGRVTVLAQKPEELLSAEGLEWLARSSEIEVETSRTSVGEAVASSLGPDGAKYPVLVTTADHALLDHETIDAFFSEAAGFELAAALVERAVLLKRFPQSRRTWLKFRGGAYSGANLFWLASPSVLPLLAVWQRIEQDRKRRWRVVGAFGPLLLIAVLLRLLTLDQAFARVGRRYGLTARAVVLPYAEACIDVDTLEDHRLASEILLGRSEQIAQSLR